MQKANPEVIAFFGNPAEAAIAMRQAKELGLKQPFFVGSNMVDPGARDRRPDFGGRRDGFFADSVLPGSKAPDMVKWEAKWKKEYPNAPAGRPNNFDLLAYGDMYVLAEGMKRAGKDLTADSSSLRSKASRTIALVPSRHPARSRPSITSATWRSCPWW